ncbi:MAG: hypothetical protein EOO01_13015 [Chitinophagaceae bacterium]|nr:MAG: hypothetical protein EOO01_13015 [Chitinophagaceae bacterium]
MNLTRPAVSNEIEKRGDRFDVVNYILEECILAYPVSSFIISLYKQYIQRGSLSKKQLQGLYAKASEIKDLNPGRLATLLALINKMPTRYRSEVPEQKISDPQNDDLEKVERILAAYPQHKGARMLHIKLKARGLLTPRESSDLARFLSLVT